MIGSATILLVEDDRALLDGIADLLEVSDTGYDVRVLKATNGLIGLDVVTQQEPDLIISDIMMPRMGGFEFLEHLRDRSEWVHIPVIFLTAKGTPDDVLKGRLSGAELYITKPYDSDELLQLVRSQLDRTFELQGDRQRQMDRLSRNIVQLLNHEFRTPLTYVTAYYQLLADGLLSDDPDSVREYLTGIQVGSKRLSNLVGNLVTVLELRTGQAERKIRQNSEQFHNVGEILHECCERQYLNEKGELVNIKSNIDEQLPQIFAHRDSLEIIIHSLIDNAVKFTSYKKDQNPEIILTAEGIENELAIAVEDNGIGLPEQVHERVFDLFYQYNRREFEQQGAGTGLTIARGLVELLGGHVDVTSIDGKGSKFTVYLPVYENGAPFQVLSTSNPEARISATILLVEDEWYLLEGLRDLIGVFESSYELTVLTARDGEEALEVMAEHEPDLIVTDIMMPRMDGFEFLSQVRNNSSWLRIPVIFLTAKGERQDILKGRSSGAEEYITKPYNADELFAVIQAQLDRHFEKQGAMQQSFDDFKRSILDLLMADLNLPLSMVSDYTGKIESNLEKLQSEDDLLAYLLGIQSGSTQVYKLVEDFMLLVELKTGKLVDWFALQARPTDANEVMFNISIQEQSDSVANAKRLHLSLTPDIGRVLIEPHLLRKCLDRLIELMVVLCDDCSSIDIALSSDQANGHVRLRVSTQAVSLSVEEARQVNLLLTKPEAVVLELSDYDPALLIAKGIVHYHEGTIAIDVEDNLGLDFVLAFPVYEPIREAIRPN